MHNGNGEFHSAKGVPELLEEFRLTGQQAPFEEIVRRYAGMVFHTCLQVTKNSHDAEDATQATFLSLAVQAKTGKPIKALGPWLAQVAYRMSLDLRKSKKRRLIREEKRAECDDRITPDGLAAASMGELRQLLVDELNKLPSKYRMPLVLHYFGGMSREEMALQLKCKTTTLGVRLHRGREMLGNRLAGRGVALAGGVLGIALAQAVHGVISDSVVANTCEAASALAAGRNIGPGIVSIQVLGVMRRAAMAVLFARAKIAAVLMLAAGTAVAGAAQIVHKAKSLDLKVSIPERLNKMTAPLRTNIDQFISSNTNPPTLPNAGGSNPSLDGYPLPERDWTMGGAPSRFAMDHGQFSAPAYTVYRDGSNFSMMWNHVRANDGWRNTSPIISAPAQRVAWAGPMANQGVAPATGKDAWQPNPAYVRPQGIEANGTAALAQQHVARATVLMPRGQDISEIPATIMAPALQDGSALARPIPGINSHPMDPVQLASADPTNSILTPVLADATITNAVSPVTTSMTGTQMTTTALNGFDAGFAMASVPLSAEPMGRVYHFASSATPITAPEPAVTHTIVTPEPGALVLAVGAAMLLMRRQRRKIS